MEIGITELILKHGLPIVIMSLIVMCIVGVVKIFTKGIVNKKVVTDKQKKWLAKLYIGLSLLLSYITILIYYAAILKQNCWSATAVRDAGIVWTVTSPLYQLYKQFGGRKLLVLVVKAVQSKFKGKNDSISDLLEVVMGIIEEDAPLLTDAQKETIQSNLSNALLNGEKKEDKE